MAAAAILDIGNSDFLADGSRTKLHKTPQNRI